MLKKGIYIIMLLILINIAYAAQPPDIISIGDVGLNLLVPGYDVYPLNTNLEMYVHVFNKSNGVLIWNRSGRNINCFNEVYYPNGSILKEQAGKWANQHIKLSLSSEDLPSEGIYSYYIYCNSSKLGGFNVKFFEVTEDGTTTPNQIEFTDNGIIMLVIIISQLFIVLLFALIGWPHKVGPVKILSWGLALIEFLMLFWFVYLNNIGGDITNLLYWNAIVSVIVGGAFGVFTLIIILMRLMNPANKKPIDDDGYTKFVYNKSFNER